MDTNRHNPFQRGRSIPGAAGPRPERPTPGAHGDPLPLGEAPVAVAPAAEDLPEILRPGSLIAGFEVLKSLGRRGLAWALEAREISQERCVLLKVLDPRLASNGSAHVRLRAEAGLAARVDHPCIQAVLSRGAAAGLEFYTEPLPAGPTLKEYLEGLPDFRGEDHYRDLAIRFAALSRAVRALHGAGIIHRGIEPSAIILEEGRLILGNFAAALELSPAGNQDPRERPEERFAGHGLARSPAHLAPEEFVQGGPLDLRSDIYSLGMTLYETAAGILPFPVIAPEGMGRLKLTRRPIAPRRLNPEIPLGLEAVIRQAIEESPLLRHGTAEELACDLERFAACKRGTARRHHLDPWSAGMPPDDGGGEELRDMARIA